MPFGVRRIIHSAGAGPDCVAAVGNASGTTAVYGGRVLSGSLRSVGKADGLAAPFRPLVG